jgi:hypothetical protein
MSHSTLNLNLRHPQQAKAILIRNNSITETTPLQPGDVLNVSDTACTDMTRTRWANESIRVCAHVQALSPAVRSLFQESAPSIGPMVSFASHVEGAGWLTGDNISTGAGIGVIAADSALAAGKHLLERIEKAGKDVVEQALAKLGKDVLMSKKPADLQLLQKFLQSNKDYQELQKLIATLPSKLQSGLGSGLTPTVGVPSADARWVRRLALVEEKGAERYFRETGALLEGKISRFGALGRGTTWVLPAVIGVYNIARANPAERFHVALEESAGISFGVFGTGLGEVGGAFLAGALGFTGVGAFILIFVGAGAGAYFISEWGKGVVKHYLDPAKGAEAK